MKIGSNTWLVYLFALPLLLQFDFVKLMDGKQLINKEPKHPEESPHGPRNLILTSMQETGFIEYMDHGAWHMAFYNDGKKMEQVLMLTTAIGKHHLLVPFLSLSGGESSGILMIM